MGQGAVRSRAVALIAAYVVALQALLASFVPPALAADSADQALAFCAGEGTQAGSKQPGQQHGYDWPCASACIMAGCGMAADHPPPASFSLAVARAEQPPAAALFWLPPPTFVGPQAARAPPLA